MQHINHLGTHFLHLNRAFFQPCSDNACLLSRQPKQTETATLTLRVCLCGFMSLCYFCSLTAVAEPGAHGEGKRSTSPASQLTCERTSEILTGGVRFPISHSQRSCQLISNRAQTKSPLVPLLVCRAEKDAL